MVRASQPARRRITIPVSSGQIYSRGAESQQPPMPPMITTPAVSSPVSPTVSLQLTNNRADGLVNDISEASGPLFKDIKTKYGRVEDMTSESESLPSRSPSPGIVNNLKSDVDEMPHDPQKTVEEPQEQPSKTPTKNPDPGSRASSSTPSLPELHELLAATQTGRKAKASIAPPQEVAESRVTPSRGRKRRHSSSQEAGLPKRREGARRRHRDFWALDGSVVLQFENTMFRLHRSDLVRRSKYFAELLASAPSHEGTDQEAVDGCPVYHVPGKAKDFERLWRAVDDAISYVHTPPPFPVFASILRAATDLEFPSFRAWAVKTFEAMWPTDLESVTAERKLHAAESIVLARSFDVPNVLRHAFYELSRHPSFGLSLDSDDEGDSEAEDGGDGEDFAMLSRDDITRLIQLRTRLQTDWLSILQMAPVSCGKGHRCRVSDAWASDIIKSTVFEEGLFDPLQYMGMLDVRGLCEGCRQNARNGWEKRKEKIWKSKLDLWLGLG